MIHTTFKDFLNENKNNIVIDNILDKINRDGQSKLTYDERTYLNQFQNDNIDKGLEDWLLSDDDDTFDIKGNKLLYDEFEEDDDIFSNYTKLKRVISKLTDKTPFTNNADWGGGYVWRIEGNDNFTGTFIYLGDDELLLLKRNYNEEEESYEDDILVNITDSKKLYNIFKK